MRVKDWHQKKRHYTINKTAMIDYCEVIKLGFKRQQETDSVFFDQNGYDWFITSLKVNKFVSFDWESTTKRVCMIRSVKGGIQNRIYIDNLTTLRTLVEFFTEFKPMSDAILEEVNF